MDRESIERSDFPLVRRGYDPAAVGAHLRAMAAAAQELSQRAASVAAGPSLGSAAATRVQGILEAAQTTAAEIEREAQRDAQSTREEAAGELERARAHVETLARAAAALLAQVQSLDGEVGALARSLRGEDAPQGEPQRGTSRGDALGEASSRGGVAQGEVVKEAVSRGGVARGEVVQEAVSHGHVSNPAPAAEEGRETSLPASAPAVEEEHGAAPSAPVPTGAGDQGSEDLDGARLVALNMALSGEPREQTERYLADSFQLSDRAKLLDEVYAAVQG
jgi:hypothetical protein